MIHRLRPDWKLPVALAVCLLVPLGVQADTEPAAPSYNDQWIQGSQRSSPFLELRNERDSDSPVAPDLPDTPVVEPVQSSGTDGESSSTVTKTDDSEEADTIAESSPTDKPSRTDSDAGDSSLSDEPETSPENTEQQQGGEESAERKSSDGKSRSRRQRRDDVTAMLFQLDPENPPAVSPSLESSAGTVTLHALSYSIPSVRAEPSEPPSGRPEPTAWWWRYRYWLTGGLVVSLITGMFFWFRRRQVTVVERSYPSAEEFFGDDIKRSRSPETESPDPRVRRVRSTEEQDVGSAETELPTESLTNVLNSYGIEDEHQALVEMYYSRGLTRREVADQSSLGKGEVGLVLDLADRIKEEAADGEGA